MPIVRWNPERSIFSLKSDMDRLFDNFFTDRPGQLQSYSDMTPIVDVEETDQAFLITAEVPGIKKDDIKITFENNYLTISGEKKVEKDRKDKNFHHMERSFGKFSRTLGIPAGVMLDKIEAEYDQGILNIKIPKAEEAKPKQIEVKVK
ncbi:MAG: Hsp20/alpha crystallin family protein [Calditrichaceae bacterium]|nr:Hsp20/alpha crystallin family protein [Calditrichaceae bacterium]